MRYNQEFMSFKEAEEICRKEEKDTEKEEKERDHKEWIW